MKRLLLVPMILVALATQAFAVLQPSEALSDPAWEERARKLSAGLRCMVCQNQSIDDSDAELARDLRVLVRERISAGETDQQVMDYVVSRYGEFVLLQPQFNIRNALLWGAPVLLLLTGGGFILAHSMRSRRRGPQALSSEEERRLAEILKASE